MAKIKVSAAFRTRLSEKMMELGNFSIVSLVLVQFASNGNLLLNALLAGIAFAVICYIISYIISS